MAIVTPDAEFTRWLTEPEGMQLEFKKAENTFSFDELVKYCCALANEGGGKIVFGVSDRCPRDIVGTNAFTTPNQTVHALLQRLGLRVDFEERTENGLRVLIMHVPGRPLGRPVTINNVPYMRSGESLVPMTMDTLNRIFAETGPDYSAEVCTKAAFADLDPASVEEFRARWMQRSGNSSLASVPAEQLVSDAELITANGVTNAALILLGTREALGRLGLAHAEVVFEYRSSKASIPYQQRLEFRQGFFSFYDALWQTINLRNDLQSYQSGLFRYDIPTFSETVVREALLNALSHRDYRLGGSVFIRQFPRHMEIISPGGFPPGITPENILDQQLPRNRRIAEVFSRCGLIERSGQGMNRMFEETIRQSKPLPDFSGSAAHEVRLTLRGEVQNPAFLLFLEKIGEERLASFTTADFLVLDAIQREVPIPEPLRSHVPRLTELGVVETIGRGRGVQYLLSRKFHAAVGQLGTYTRRRGLDRETNKELLLRHLRDKTPDGSPLSELCQVLPALSEGMVQTLLQELRTEEKVLLTGQRRWGRWSLPPTKIP